MSSKSGSAISVDDLGEILSREEDGADIVGLGGVASSMKPHDMYDSGIESAGTNGPAAPRIESAVRVYYCFLLLARSCVHSPLY